MTEVHNAVGTSLIWLIFCVMRSAQSMTLTGLAMPERTAVE
jgi:hypothetical protein